jgi:hypothetical protein
MAGTTFDPSVISDIGGDGPDVTGSIAKGLTLSDLYDQNTLNKIKVQDAKTQQSDMTYAKQILAGKDLTKLEDQNEAVAKIAQRSPQLGMELMKSFQGAQAEKTSNQMAQLQLYNAKNDIIGGAVYQLKAKHDQLIQQGQSEQQVHDAMKGDLLQTIQGLRQATLPDGTPVLNQQDLDYLKQNFSNGYNPGAVDALVAKSAQAKQAIAEKLAQQKQGLAERRETDTERRTDIQDKKANSEDAARAAAAKAASDDKLAPEDAAFMAQQYLAGDKSVLQNVGRGKQGAGNIVMVRKAIRTTAEAQGLKPADVAARLAEYNGYMSEQRTMGTQQANVEMASSEAQQMIQNARGASDDTAVARAHVLGWNKIEQWGAKELQDPKLASLKAATTAVINTWARAINPKGVATVADKEHGYDLLSAAQDKATYDAVLDRFEQETQASLAAPQSAKARLHDAFLAGQTPAAGAAGAASPPSGTPQSPAAGTGLTPTPGRGAPPAGGPAAQGPPPPPGFVVQ